MSTTEKAPAAPSLDDLFAAAIVEPVVNKKGRSRWDGPIPDALRALVKRAATTKERIVLPCTDLETYDQVIRMAITAAETEAPGKVVYGTARHDDKTDPEKITAVTFTVGDKRGRKNTEDAEVAAAQAREAALLASDEPRTESEKEQSAAKAPVAAPPAAKATGKAAAASK